MYEIKPLYERLLLKNIYVSLKAAEIECAMLQQGSILTLSVHQF